MVANFLDFGSKNSTRRDNWWTTVIGRLSYHRGKAGKSKSPLNRGRFKRSDSPAEGEQVRTWFNSSVQSMALDAGVPSFQLTNNLEVMGSQTLSLVRAWNSRNKQATNDTGPG